MKHHSDNHEIEDGMGFSGLAPSPGEKKLDAEITRIIRATANDTLESAAKVADIHGRSGSLVADIIAAEIRLLKSQ